ncbi:hypothetical protein DRO49_06205 [Candidatus Bathyarchaeota archaeon]|nr:MAG: hypothetical protein DRO49_06205 [Candidatus Bathyarchaeota archaeon]
MLVLSTILLFAFIPQIASAAVDNTPPDITDKGSREAHGEYCKTIEIFDNESGVKKVEIIKVDNAGRTYIEPKKGWDVKLNGSKKIYKWRRRDCPKNVTIDIVYKKKTKPITIKVKAMNGDGYWSKQKTITNPAIPEFTTIAIPVAAILGLVFLFSRRKR